MPREALHQPPGAQIAEAFLVERSGNWNEAGLFFTHGDRAHAATEHQPLRHLRLCRLRGPRQAAAADEAAIDFDGVWPDEGYGPLRRRVRR
jgi:hypothetical protein